MLPNAPPEEPLYRKNANKFIRFSNSKPQDRQFTHLETNNRQSHHTEIYHTHRVFAPQETAVEEADTWNHDPDEGGGGEDPSDVAEVVDDIRLSVWVVPDKRPS